MINLKEILKKDIARDLLVMLIAGSVICFFVFFPQRHVLKNSRYTIAVVEKIDYRGEGDPSAVIQYTVNTGVYDGIISSYKGNGESYQIGDRVFVAYSPEYPNECNLVNTDVPKSIVEVPENGWDSIPK